MAGDQTAVRWRTGKSATRAAQNPEGAPGPPRGACREPEERMAAVPALARRPPGIRKAEIGLWVRAVR
ncbi:Hypothetical predicted protein [Marmota monax]|uniref:Uncharacterized protein n=1 Tax=Marmota monax TaxID=9995 RepID=A0A5E4AL12_MARMO|nr:hypothetical protein GHT09_008477 [Marmota monax]VTJ58133.1 Hypothetical predicted protein [Marmota monax]